MNMSRLKVLLVKHEGDRRHPYKDTAGALTIGVGHNLDGKPLSDAVTQLILDEDIWEAWHACQRIIPGFDVLEEARQHALMDMTFNLGEGGLLGFKKMLEAVEQREWEIAADEALDSKWAQQVGERAKTVARMLREGVA